jgi:hypothetical protein
MQKRVVTRRLSNPQILKQSKQIQIRYEFAAYRGEKEVIGVYKQHSRNVVIEAFGIMIIRITQYQESDYEHEFDLGILTARNYEIYYLLGKMQSIDISNFNHITTFIKKEALSWSDSFEKAAKNQLRREMGLNRFSPFPSSKITICKPGKDINFID